MRRRCSCLAGAPVYVSDIGRDLRRAARGLLDVARDLLRSGALLFDSGRDGARVCNGSRDAAAARSDRAAWSQLRLRLKNKEKRWIVTATPDADSVGMTMPAKPQSRIARRDAVIGLGACAAALSLPRRAFAAYPDKPIKLIVPFPAGGGGDALCAHGIDEDLRHSWPANRDRQSRRAGGNIGTAAAARAEPDGYKLAYGTNGTHAINHTLYKNPGFDPLADFEPISRLTEIALMLIVTPSMPVKTLPELMAYLKANPGKVNAATAGNGTSSHLAAQMFKTATGLDFVIVHYRGGGPAMTDLISGQVQMMIEVMPNAFPQVEGGKMRGIAVTTAKRWPQTPDIPTFVESGLPGFYRHGLGRVVRAARYAEGYRDEPQRAPCARR